MQRRAFVALLPLVLLFASPTLAVQRVFVASYGNDANTAGNCTFLSPCRSFSAAMTVVDPAGEVVALDAAGYSTVTITKSVTITANPGFYAGVAVGTGNGITVATPGVKVTLRGLNINSVGGTRAVSFTSGARLSIENCLITNFVNEGVFVDSAAVVRIVDSTIRDNGAGVVIQGGAVATITGSKLMGNTNEGLAVNATPGGSTTSASVSDSTLSGNLVGLSATAPTAAVAHAAMSRSMSSNNGKGVVADGGSGTVVVTIGDSLITGNSVSGLAQVGSATLESQNNVVRQNGTDTSGSITTLAGGGGGGVTSVATGTGLTGGPITTTGTIGLAATQLLPSVACTATQIPKWNGSAWACAADNDTNSGGTVTGVTASSPLASSGGTTPNITLASTIGVTSGGTGASTLASNGILYGQGTSAIATAVGTTGQLLAGTAGAPAWTGSPSISGNLTLPQSSSSSVGNIYKGSTAFLHNYNGGTFVGGAGNFTLTGNGTTAVGSGVLMVADTGSANTGVGEWALHFTTTGSHNTGVGLTALRDNVAGSGNTAVGELALSQSKGSGNIGIGQLAGAALTSGDNNIYIASNEGANTETGNIRVGISGTHVKTFIAGIRGVTPVNNDGLPVIIDSSGQLGTTVAGTGTVTSVGTGTGLTGGPVTTTGTISIASGGVGTTQIADGAVTAVKLASSGCVNTQILKFNGSAWVCSSDANSGGTVTGVTASSPLASSGGATPNIGLSGTISVGNGGTGTNSLTSNGVLYGQGTSAIAATAGSAGQVLTGTAGAPAWSDSATLNGNVVLSTNPSTSSAGNILKGANRFIHNFGANNTFVGVNAGNFTMTGAGNTVAGAAGLSANTSGGNNTAIGNNVLTGNTTGANNTASGVNALSSNTTGSRNTASGVNALLSASADDNTALGFQALTSDVSGTRNTAVGAQALLSNTTDDNTAVGYQALSSDVSGTRNAALGAQALLSNTGNDNTAIGYHALKSNTSMTFNTAVGSRAMEASTNANYSTAVGYAALAANTLGYENTALGAIALTANTSGINNTAVGTSALSGNTTGNANTALGRYTLVTNTAGGSNTAVGHGALYSADASGNTAVGKDSLVASTTGVNNVAVGYGALSANTTGSANIAVGLFAGSALTTTGSNIDIGHPGVAGDSGITRIGSAGTHVKAFISGITGVSVTGAAVLVDGNGQLGVNTSSRRFKEDIADMDAASNGLMKLRPVTFHYKAQRESPDHRLQYGLLAEEVEDVYPGLVLHALDGQVDTVMYQFLAPMLLNEYQKQQRAMAAQAAQLEYVERRLAALERVLEAQISAKLETR